MALLNLRGRRLVEPIIWTTRLFYGLTLLGKDATLLHDTQKRVA
jgi:hypothetical protein